MGWLVSEFERSGTKRPDLRRIERRVAGSTRDLQQGIDRAAPGGNVQVLLEDIELTSTAAPFEHGLVSYDVDIADAQRRSVPLAGSGRRRPRAWKGAYIVKRSTACQLIHSTTADDTATIGLSVDVAGPVTVSVVVI